MFDNAANSRIKILVVKYSTNNQLSFDLKYLNIWFNPQPSYFLILLTLYFIWTVSVLNANIQYLIHLKHFLWPLHMIFIFWFFFQ